LEEKLLIKESLKIEPNEEKIGSKMSLETSWLLITIFNGLFSLLFIIIVDPLILSKSPRFSILRLSKPSIPRFPRTLDKTLFI
jgi:hypothetical protein